MFAKKQQHCLNIQCAPGCCFRNFLKEKRRNAHRLIVVPRGLFIEFLTIFKILFFLRIWSKLYWRFQQTLKMYKFPKFTQNCMNTATPNQGWVREDFQLPDVDLLRGSPPEETHYSPKLGHNQSALKMYFQTQISLSN